MSRRGNSEGSIRRRPDGRWEARVRTADGRRQSLYGETRAEVARALAAAVRDRDRGILPAREDITTAAWLASWLETVKPPVLEVSTWRRYEEYVRLHLVPALGTTRLARLAPAQVERLYADQLAAGAASTSVNHLHRCLHRALEKAVRQGLIPRNVTDLVDAPPAKPKEMRPLSREEADQLLAAARGDRLEALYVLAVQTGMRRGELLGLPWAAVTLTGKHPHLEVRQSLKRDLAGQFVFGRPKTKRSRRRIALAAASVAALKAHRARQAREQLAAGPGYTDQGLVFCDQIGGALAGDNLLRTAFYPLLSRAGLPRVRFHDLRHTAATLLLTRRVNPKIVSELLGHASVAITLDTYSHVLPDMQGDATAAMDSLFAAWEDEALGSGDHDHGAGALGAV